MNTTLPLSRFVCLLVLALSANIVYAGGKTYYTKATATVSGNGKVYVEKQGGNTVITPDQITQTSVSCEQSSVSEQYGNSDSKPATYDYYNFYAVGDDGYAFEKWETASDNNAWICGTKYGQDFDLKTLYSEKGGDVKGSGPYTETDNPLIIQVFSQTEKQAAAPNAALRAVFVPTTLKAVTNNFSLGGVRVTPVSNNVGDEVEVEAVFNTPHATWQHDMVKVVKHSNSVKFEGWFNQDGVCVSEESKMKYTVTKTETLEARFSREFALKGDASGNIKGYYRIATPFSKDANKNKFMCVTGNFTITPNTSSGTNLTGLLHFNEEQTSQSAGENYAGSDAVFSNAGSIIYVTGTLTDEGTANATAAHAKVAKDFVASAQGVSTSSMLSGVTPWLETSNTPGFYIIYIADGGNLQLLGETYTEQIRATKDKQQNRNYRECGDFDIQPVDLGHIDTNYFGAYPSKDMAYDGGYWTSMYTSFPYECYEEDGVEAYVVNGKSETDGVVTVATRRLKSGIVPAATPVLLKCKGLTPKENRLIPLLPDDERLEAAKAEADGNLLAGDYGLWTSASKTGRNKYDDQTMRVFSVNTAGEIGFYRLADKDQELKPNRAYLDLSKLNLEGSAPAAVRIVADRSGIENVTDSWTDNASAVYYNLQGIRVENPAAGEIYIEHRGDTTRKVVFK